MNKLACSVVMLLGGMGSNIQAASTNAEVST